MNLKMTGGTIVSKITDLAAELRYDLVPAYINYDCDRNYPLKSVPAFEGSATMVETVANALHPTMEGYRQWADSEFFWLKSISR